MESPLSDLMDFLRTSHGVRAEAGPLPGYVTASSEGRSVTVLLVGRQWFRQIAAERGNTLVPLHWHGMEWSVARTVAKTLAEDET
ncbi:hypothetical protein [Nocardiopsis sp. TNDT3]|uniref:hypothetical protein n=1 Tax=Nocardiopsis sp. TNDT3 TaxID=2249354 RepID=UPI0018E5098E|nr:hypothetical protein [Nocardiopsis sp. TNDT3]